MKLNIYAIMDNKMSAFMTPFFSHNDQTAQRSLKIAVTTEGSPMSAAPEDFDLYKIGVFCDESGLIEPDPTPVFVVRAAHLKEKSSTDEN